MSSATYDIVFKGSIIEGFDRDGVKNSLSKLFGIGDAQVEALFRGKSVVLKRGLPQAEANKFREAMAKVGAEAILRAIESDADAINAAKAMADPETVHMGDQVKPVQKPQLDTAIKPTGKSGLRTVPNSGRAAAKVEAIEQEKIADESKLELVAEPIEPPIRESEAGEAPAVIQAAIADSDVCCPRCGHEQEMAMSCGRCKMDLRQHLRRMERKARIHAIRRSSAAG